MTAATNTIAIPLNRLVPGKENVRRTGRTVSIGELTASILAHGLRQNLNVRATEDGRYEVVAGGRRLRALKQLAKSKQLPKDHPVPCRVLTEGEDAGEISLVENVCRVAMHPADQFEAFHDLVNGRGFTIEQVAERFGVEPSLVEKRLKLAAVHPKLFAAYRKGDMNLDCLMAFTVSDDHEAQLRVWQGGRHGYLSAQHIRRSLTEGAIPADHKLALYVGLEAYTAAGGGVMRDLFDERSGGYLTDSGLVMRLAAEKIEAVVEDERAAGWKWVKAELETDYTTYYGCVRSVSFEDPCGDEDDEDTTDEAEAEGAQAEPDYGEDEKARSGVLIRVSRDGTLDIQRGLVHPDDLPRSTAAAKATKADPVKGEYSGPLVQDLTAHRTAALRLAMASNPAVALAATVHAMALPLLYRSQSGTCLDLSAKSRDLAPHASEDCTAYAKLGEMAAHWQATLPESAHDLMAWCVNAGQDVLLDLLAYLSALSVDAIRLRHDQTSADLKHADQLADILSLDMREHWTGSDGFYVRLSKPALVQVISEAKAPIGVSIAVLKKAEAARHVAKAVAGTGWLPVPLRSPAQPPAPAAA